MGQSQAIGTSVVSKFGASDLKANAAVYAGDKRIMDAASTYDSLADAIAALTSVYETMERQAENGAEFTPSLELGFGSDSAAVIAESILGRRSTVGATRTAFKKLGK